MTTPRIRVPTLFDGNWDSVIISTYGADLAFFERDLWRQIERAKNRIIFADGRQVTRQLLAADATHLRHVNRTYVLAQLRTMHAAHAKLILLLAEDRALLAVGSGNIGMNGYASQGECFTTYHWSEAEPQHLDAFIAAKDFLEEVLRRGLVDDLIGPRLHQAWQDAPWIYRTDSGAPPPVRHNLDTPLLDQFIAALDGRPVEELTVHAPFYDHQCRALAELIERVAPQKLQVLIQERITSVDPVRMSAVLDAAACSVDVRTVEAEETGTFLHAKFYVARCATSAVCLQGSPNLSTPALLQVDPTGNIELANLLEGARGDFDHLIADLVVSPDPVDLNALGLSLTKDDDDPEDEDPVLGVRELAWVPPRLIGVFDSEIRTPPDVMVGDSLIDDVKWHLDEPAAGTTRFTATLGETSAAGLARVASVTFIFATGERTPPSYPYHLNTLIALASGQGRTDLLKQAGDFDLGDEELEQLLTQLDEVLVVDGRSLWKMLKKSVPVPTDDDESSPLSYDDLDWDAIQSHPKLAQYRAWDQRGHTDPTGLGILLGSIADRFRAEVDIRSGRGPKPGEPPPPEDPLDDLARTIEAEDEEAAESEEIETDRRRMNARTRARRQFRSFVKRFINGLTDDEFVRLVGPSVILPSYVVFNHLCWKLAQLDLIDRSFSLHAQIDLWKFFWGDGADPGYLATMSEPEQLAALEILDAHSAEAVMLASLHQAYEIAWQESDSDVVRLRDEWRVMLVHDLGSVGIDSVRDAATVSGAGPKPLSVEEFVEELAGLAEFTTESEATIRVAAVAGCSPGSVTQRRVKVHRGELGDRSADVFEIEDPTVVLSAALAEDTLAELARLFPETDYLRIHHGPSRTVAFADYELDLGLWVSLETDEEVELAPPEAASRSWDIAVDRLQAMVA